MPEPADTPLPHRADTPLLTEAEQLAFFDTALVGAQMAEARTEMRVVHLDLAGTIVAVRFVGNGVLDAFLPALSHLVVESPGAPGATLHVWDSQSSGVPMVSPPCPRESFTHRGDIWGMSSARIRSAFHWHEFSVNLFDHQRRIGLFWVQDARSLPYWSRASPLRTLFHWWLEANDVHLLHAAAIGTPRGGLLLVGKGGTGKSTTALTCLEAGLQFVADDYLAVRLDPEPVAYSLYATAKLAASQLGRFRQLAQHQITDCAAEDEKIVLRLLPAFASQVVRRMPLRAVASSVFCATPESSFVADRGGSTRRSASFTTLSQLPHAGRALHTFVDRLVDALPSFTFLLGSDVSLVPDAVVRHLNLGDDALYRLARSSAADIKHPLVSVVIPVFNGAALLGAAVTSVLAQSWRAVEIIVVDDGSSDEIEAAVRALPVDVLFIRQTNAGPAAARNRGIDAASGELIAFLDVDDLWTNDHLEALHTRFSVDPSLDLVHGLAQVTALDQADAIGEYLGNPHESFPYYLGAGLYRRRVFEMVGGFDPELRFGEDTDWFQRGRAKGLRISRIEEVVLFVRRHAGNSTRGKSLQELNALRVLKRHLDRQRAESASLAD